ncbi:hypothetical protein CDO27_14785 [Sinorhizobium meliloti]|nr:hypothetical protein CDO27_14785 [Sinorhizobium meliloti]ASP90240.1 hypothetical protein CDO25_02910 [Sinorhizobium meliloti]
MTVIDSKTLRRGMRAENRAHFSSSRSNVQAGCSSIALRATTRS